MQFTRPAGTFTCYIHISPVVLKEKLFFCFLCFFAQLNLLLYLLCVYSWGVSDGPKPDDYPHHCWSSSGWSGADHPCCLSNRQEEEPCWLPGHLSDPSLDLNHTGWLVKGWTKGCYLVMDDSVGMNLSEWKCVRACVCACISAEYFSLFLWIMIKLLTLDASWRNLRWLKVWESLNLLQHVNH